MMKHVFLGFLFALVLLESGQKGTASPFEADHEFDHGTGITIASLTSIQVDNLVALGRVWGFLKYHHPAVTSGQRNWDYDLFRILPGVLAASDRNGANGALVRWIDGLGEFSLCSANACTPMPSGGDLDLKPDIEWIHDSTDLGLALSMRLERIYQNRPRNSQFYVSLHPFVNNASFDHEPSYADITFPDAGFQLLALYRWWNIMQYWAPYRKEAGENWGMVLAEFIPKMVLARDRNAYELALFELAAKANDTHANLWNVMEDRPPAGPCSFPVSVRFIENQAVITGVNDPSGQPVLQGADIIQSLDGTPLSKLIEQWTPYYADSNQAARLRDMALSLKRGKCGPAMVTILRDSKPLSLSAERLPMQHGRRQGMHDLPGETFRLLSKDVAYLKLSSIKAADVRHDMELARHTKGLVVDILSYPSDFVPFALGSFLVKRRTPFAMFTMPDLGNPGAFHFGNTVSIQPGSSLYEGKVVILVDEVTQSQAEYTAMALRAAPGAIVVGSTTAGADGNVSEFYLPGGIHTMISGIGVFYPDRRPTQRIGILPDVEARPTIAGITSGRDEVLETAVREILGRSVSEDEVQKMARRGQ